MLQKLIKFNLIFSIFLYFIFSFWEKSYSSQLHKMITVNIQPVDSAKIATYQRLFVNQSQDITLVRDHRLSLSLSPIIELGFNIPYINQIRKNGINPPGTAGDIKVYLNIATPWLKEYVALNWFLEYNTGSGPTYNNILSPAGNYGFEEWRTGIVGAKVFTFISLHWNLFYIFNKENEDENGLFKSFFNGSTLNIFNVEAYKRGLGFNPAHQSSFFYYKNFINDSIEMNIGINSKILYPVIIFIEFNIYLPFNTEFYKNYINEKNETTIGIKILTLEENINLNMHFSMQLNKNIHSGIGIEIIL